MGIKLGAGKKIENNNFGPNMKEHELNLSKACDKGTLRVRLVGEVQPGYRYWVKNIEGKHRTVITPYFDREEETWLKGDPLASYQDARKEFFYTINCIDRSDGQMKILPIKRTIYQYIYSIAQDPEYGDPSDEENGYDLIIGKEKTGPLPINVKYTVLPGRNSTPLTADEKGMELFDLAESYKPLSMEAYTEWVSKNTFALTANTETTENTPGTEEDIPF